MWFAQINFENNMKIYDRVFIKYCVILKILRNIQDSGLSRFPLVIVLLYMYYNY